MQHDPTDLIPAAQAAIARRRFLWFCERMYPGFQSPEFIRYLCDLADQFARGDVTRIILNISVRHAKSVLFSQLLVAYLLGRDPRSDIVLASHSEDLAARNSRIAKSYLLSDDWPFDVKLAPDSTSVGRWNTAEGGGVFAVGVGSNITGRPANVAVVDDPLNDGLSELANAAAFRWFTEILTPRLEPKAKVIIISARLSPTDFCQRVLDSEDGPNWTVVRLPAIAEESDPIGRLPGEALWPSRFPLEELNMRRVAMGERAFNAQFQQAPTPISGDLIKLEWLEHAYRTLPQDVRTIMSLDCAVKTGVGNDWSVLTVLAISDSSYYVRDVIRRKVEFPSLVRMVHEAYERYHPSSIYVEDAASGSPLIASLKSTRLPIVGVTPKGSKIARLEAVLGLFESGRVLLPDSAPWKETLIRELLDFPGGRHDDQVDSLSLALSKAQRKTTTWSFATASADPVRGLISASPFLR